MLYDSIEELIGMTPIVKLKSISPKGKSIYVKYEAFNPSASVKDRLALAIILEAEAKGILSPGSTIIECTSGNVGISLAMLSASRGYNFVAVMGNTFSVERRKLIRALGGKVLLFEVPKIGSAGGNQWADSLAKEFGWFRPRQFANQANVSFHMRTTAAEIIQDFSNIGLEGFVAGYGTGGTLSGVGRMLKVSFPKTKIVTFEPEKARMLSKGKWSRHGLQGLTPNFIPEIMDLSVIDEVDVVSDLQAREMSLRLAKDEGILAGMSGGAAVLVAKRLVDRLEPGAKVLAMLPDSSERYLSSYLFESVYEGSDHNWLKEQRELLGHSSKGTSDLPEPK